jgi:hypothetical protein
VRFLIIGLLAACGSRTELVAPEPSDASIADVIAHDAHDAGHDVAVVDVIIPDVGTSALCSGADSGPPVTTCNLSIKVGPIKKNVTCFVDTVVHEGDIGVLELPCGGDPSTFALAHFPTGDFAGGFQGNIVDVCTGTTFPWSDGCTWASAQRINGDISTGKLTFTYAEQPIVGHPCEPSCPASADVTIQ